MFDTDRFQAAIELGYGGREADALRELGALRQEAVDGDERGWVIIYEARFLGHLLRIQEARDRLAELDTIEVWRQRPEYRARAELGGAVLYELEDDPERTLKELNRILKQYSSWWNTPEWEDVLEEVQANRGRLLARKGRFREALPLLEFIAASEKGKPGEFYYNLGASYCETGQWDKAEPWLQDALVTGDLDEGRVAVIHFYLGHLEFRRTAYARALVEFETAYKHSGSLEWVRRRALDELVGVCDRLGLHKEARRYEELAKS
jgi:tetratricopeptide (TPR) repeat protein